MKYMTKTMELVESNYEIGRELEEIVAGVPQLRVLHAAIYPGSGEKRAKEAMALFERWCPGFSEELSEFAEVLQVPASQLAFYTVTNLRPNCSQIAVLPPMTESGEPLPAGNHEFSPMFKGFTLVRTSVPGKYRHVGTSMFLFGREDGFNECGLAVTMGSCGMPVGAEQRVRQAGVDGLQYWATIRTLLENCRDVKEALAYVEEMPIAFSLNLMLVDKSGRVTLTETLDGHMAVRRIPESGGEQYLCVTNHQVMPELITCEPVAMRHSPQRYHWIQEKVDHSDKVGREQLGEVLLSMYPKGMCCHFYGAFFGTTRSMVINPAAGTVELCWGRETANGWKVYRIEELLQTSTAEVGVHNMPFQRELGEFLPIE